MSHSLLSAVKAFQWRFKCDVPYVMEHNPEHLIEEVKELKSSLIALKKKAKEYNIPWSTWQGCQDLGDTAPLMNEMTDVADALSDITFLVHGVWAKLGLSHSDIEACNLIVADANLTKVYAPAHPKRAIKLPTWEKPEIQIKEIIKRRSRIAGNTPTSWTPDAIERETARIELLKQRAGPTNCIGVAYMGLRVQYIDKSTGKQNGVREYYGCTQPGEGCVKAKTGGCPKRCEFRVLPSQDLFVRLLTEFEPPASDEQVVLQMTYYGYKKPPEKSIKTFKEIIRKVNAEAFTITQLIKPPKVEDGARQPAMVRVFNAVLSSYQVSKSTLAEIERLILKEQQS
jgi:hypothetical protein